MFWTYVTIHFAYAMFLSIRHNRSLIKEYGADNIPKIELNTFFNMIFVRILFGLELTLFFIVMHVLSFITELILCGTINFNVLSNNGVTRHKHTETLRKDSENIFALIVLLALIALSVMLFMTIPFMIYTSQVK